jgi:hypothetical protein
MASIAGAFAAATDAVLAEARRISAASRNLADTAASTQEQVQQTDAELVAFVHRMAESGIHVAVTDSHGKLIDDGSGTFSQGEAHGIPTTPEGWDSQGHSKDGLFQKNEELQPTSNPGAKPPLSYNDDPNGYQAPTQHYGDTGAPVAAPTPPPSSSSGSDQFIGAPQDYPIDNTGGDGGGG